MLLTDPFVAVAADADVNAGRTSRNQFVIYPAARFDELMERYNRLVNLEDALEAVLRIQEKINDSM